jgi:hypothetical protein
MLSERTNLRTRGREAVLAGLAAAVLASGGIAMLASAPEASGVIAGPPSGPVVSQRGGTPARAVDPHIAHEFEGQLSAMVPGYRIVPEDSYDYADDGGASYARLTGRAQGFGAISVSVYRHFEASELRSAGLPESTDASAGTFWVGALDQDLTTVYFEPVDGPPIWVGASALTPSGPAPALAEVKALATRIAGLPVVTSIAEGD